MLTTLYCDASFCHQSKVGGWAVWLRSDQGRHVESGPMPDYCTSSNDAELAAIYAGIYRAATMWPQAEVVLVRSDSDTALNWMARRHEASSPGSRRLVAKIRDLEKQHRLRLVPRWVQSHQRGNTTDAYLNRRVDQMAYDEMCKERRRAPCPKNDKPPTSDGSSRSPKEHGA